MSIQSQLPQSEIDEYELEKEYYGARALIEYFTSGKANKNNILKKYRIDGLIENIKKERTEAFGNEHTITT